MSTSSSLQLREITPSDLEELTRFILRASGSTAFFQHALGRLNWILLENPVRQLDDPIGWLLRAPSGGEIVGCMCCAPQKFSVGQTTVRLMMANSFYVEDQRRGSGTSIFLKYLQLARRCPLFVSSANPTVAQMWQKLGAHSLPNSDHEVVGILRWPPLLAENAHRQTSSPLMAELAANIAKATRFPWKSSPRFAESAAQATIQTLETPEQAALVCAQHQSDKITASRDVAFLKWRYFSRIQSTSVFAFRLRDGAKQFMVAVQLQHRGFKQQIRSLQVLDIWGEPDFESCLAIAGCLLREYHGRIDMLVFRCLNAVQQQALIAKGFRVRRLNAPIAWYIDKSDLLSSDDWYFVPADGDMFL